MITENSLLDELIAERPILKPIVSRFNIQAVQNKSIKEVCVDKDIHCDFMLSLLNAIGGQNTFQKDWFEQYDSEILIDYLIKSHNQYLYKTIPELEQNFDYLLRNFRATNPYLSDIAPLFVKFRDNFVEHIQKEEENFFPYLLGIDKVNTFSIRDFNCDAASALLDSYSAEKFLKEHDDVECLLSEIRLKLAHHSITGKLSFVHNVFLSQVVSLETDLKRHAVLEEEIIFNRALEIENQLKQKVVHFKMYHLTAINGSFL